MEEFYKLIENKIKACGYPEPVDGAEIYNDICDEIEDKENGSYLLLSKKDDGIVFEYQITVMSEEFNLSTLTIHTPVQDYLIDFDKE